MPNPTAAFLVIGDEILSGRTREANVQVLARRLGGVGVDLREVRVVRDDTSAIVAALNALRGTHDVVVTSGGIGPTHDDITADAVAAAFGVGIGVRDDARTLMEALAAERAIPVTDGLLRMARIPDGAALVANSISGAPGFSIGNVHVLAGVPAIFEAMVEALLPALPTGTRVVSAGVVVERGEAAFAADLARVAADFPDLSVGSYPFRREHGFAVEIVARGTDPARVEQAVARLLDEVGGTRTRSAG